MYGNASLADVGRREEQLVAAVVSVGVLAVAFGALAVGIDWFWVAFPVGYGGVLPLSVALVRARARRETGTDDARAVDDPVSAAADAYVRGEVDVDGLEGRLESALDGRTAERRGGRDVTSSEEPDGTGPRQ